MKKIILVAIFIIAINQLRVEIVAAKEQVLGTVETVETVEAVETVQAQVGEETTIEEDNANERALKLEQNYNKIPENVRVRFEEDNGRIIVSKEDFGEKFGYNFKIKGLFNFEYDENKNPVYTIYIKDSEGAINTIIHEMGHYVDFKEFYISSSEEFKGIHAEEVNAFAEAYKTHENNYSTEDEYFAQAFMNCYVDAEGMKESCPKTYEYIMNVVNNF